jgi:signal transduction histidine kinase
LNSAVASLLKRWHTFASRQGMATRLILAFYALALLTILPVSLTIVTLTNAYLHQSMDLALRRHARSLQAIVQNDERDLVAQASAAANQEGISVVLANHDGPMLQRMLTSVMVSSDLDSLYVVDPLEQGGRILVRLGEPTQQEEDLMDLSLMQRGLGSGSASSVLEMDGSLWLGAVAAHRLPGGQVDGLILVRKRLDQPYLRSLQQILGGQIVILASNRAVYSFEAVPPELSVSYLRASMDEVAEYRAGPVAYHSMDIGNAPYRVAAFVVPTLGGEVVTALILQPSDSIQSSLRHILIQVGGIGLISLVVGSVGAFAYVRTVTRSLSGLAQAARTIAAGNLELPVLIPGEDEAGQVAQTFESMRLRVREMLHEQQQWNSHLEGKVRAKADELRQLSHLRDELLHRTITAQEEERARVARELHDETCQSLTALLATLSAARQLPPEEAATRLAEVRALTVQTLTEVNRIVLDLRPTLLDDYGLLAALRWYAEARLVGTGVRLESSISDTELRLPAVVETSLFRVGQEAIANIAKHANASCVRLNLLLPEDGARSTVVLQIEDDGCGFDLGTVDRATVTGRPHLGLVGMKERVFLVGGHMEIRSSPGKGTCICVTVPLSPHDTKTGVETDECNSDSPGGRSYDPASWAALPPVGLS